MNNLMQRLNVQPGDFLSLDNVQVVINIEGVKVPFGMSKSLMARCEVLAKEQGVPWTEVVRQLVAQSAAETTISNKGIHADTALLDFAEQPGVMIDGSGASEDGEQTCGWYVNGETYPGGMSLRQCLNDAMCKRADSGKAA